MGKISQNIPFKEDGNVSSNGKRQVRKIVFLDPKPYSLIHMVLCVDLYWYLTFLQAFPYFQNENFRDFGMSLGHLDLLSYYCCHFDSFLPIG
jgi:hypothetical protein